MCTYWWYIQWCMTRTLSSFRTPLHDSGVVLCYTVRVRSVRTYVCPGSNTKFVKLLLRWFVMLLFSVNTLNFGMLIWDFSLWISYGKPLKPDSLERTRVRLSVCQHSIFDLSLEQILWTFFIILNSKSTPTRNNLYHVLTININVFIMNFLQHSQRYSCRDWVLWGCKWVLYFPTKLWLSFAVKNCFEWTV